MAFNYEKLTVEQDGMVLVAAINHPPANSMGQGVLRDLNDLLDKCENDDNVRVIILTGTGSKLFSAGADITEFADIQAGKMPKYDGNEIYFRIENYPKVIIAAMQGGAYGGGLELACCCHLRIMSETATLGLPEVKLGLNPGWGGTQRLPRFIGKTKALELNRRGYIVANDSGRTTRAGVWAGGDIVTGSATVILAMGAGKAAARDIHAYLSGNGQAGS